MILCVTVKGIIEKTRAAFLAQFAVKCDSAHEAKDAVVAGLDWSDAFVHHVMVQPMLDESPFLTLQPGHPARI